MTPASVDTVFIPVAAPRRPPAFDVRLEPPRLSDPIVSVRELALDDDESLAQQLSDPQVAEYLSPGPSTAAGFRGFARWALAQRAAGAYVCFAVVPAGERQAVGLVQFWPVESNWATAEWGFVIGRRYWGTGVFVHAAHLLLEFAFTQLGVMRLEARTVVGNARADAVLRKLGAAAEGRLRCAFDTGAGRVDAVMWSLLADEYLGRRLEQRRLQ